MRWGYNPEKIIRRDGKCVYCESRDDLTIDHVIPLSRARSYRLPRRELDTAGNIVTSCGSCNQEKSDRDAPHFFEDHPDYKKNFRKNARYVSDKVKHAIGL